MLKQSNNRAFSLTEDMECKTFLRFSQESSHGGANWGYEMEMTGVLVSVVLSKRGRDEKEQTIFAAVDIIRRSHWNHGNEVRAGKNRDTSTEQTVAAMDVKLESHNKNPFGKIL